MARVAWAHDGIVMETNQWAMPASQFEANGRVKDSNNETDEYR